MIEPVLLAAVLFAPAQDSAPALVDEGRRLLEEGQLTEAQERFERAATLDGSSAATRVWVVRGWLANGQIDEALGATDELKQAGASEQDLNYLYGLGFHAAALREAAGGGGTFTQSRFEDAVRFLTAATDSDLDRYGDSLLALAESAWYAQQLATAADTAARATRRRPGDASAHLMLGRIEFSRYSAALAVEGATSMQDVHWTSAKNAFEGAVEALGTPTVELDQFRLAEAWVQVGHLWVWKENPGLAAEAYGQAMAWDPRAVDFNQIMQAVGDEAAAAGIGAARAVFDERHGPEHPARSLLAWWDGFINFTLFEMELAEAAFYDALETNPDATNSWYYIFRATHAQRKFDDSLIALRANWRQDRDTLMSSLNSDLNRNLSALESLVRWLIDTDEQADGERYREAALLEDIRTALVPTEARYWNNLGLFLRDHGDQLKLAVYRPDKQQLDELWRDAYAAYLVTLELEPEHPAYLNDTAVMLHYYLKRDWDESQRLYEQAMIRAAEELAREDLSAGLREWFTTVLDDAGTNLKRLERMRTDRRGKSDRPVGAGAGN
jgi:tetratricopeptide (TPR) repeat protein